MAHQDDYADSDDMEAIAQLLSTTETVSTPRSAQNEPSYIQKNRIQTEIGKLDAEFLSINQEIARLEAAKQTVQQEKANLQKQLNALSKTNQVAPISFIQGESSTARTRTGTNYSLSNFEWSGGMKARMYEVFGIQDFRLCQEGVCNASVDGRDIVCVMPTGGGKSLTYQLPALFAPGCTIVISPLIALITDQIIHLREAGVEAVMLTGATPKALHNKITSRMQAMASGRIANDEDEKEIKLCYVTPEKIAKSKGFTPLLEKLANAGKLARIVIDEAHCVSELGHDFRPDYKKLSILRQLFPNVPITAVSATCPPKVLEDLLRILKLERVVDGKDAPTRGTIYYSAPLYRKNLHYKVLSKSSSGPAAVKEMAQYILDNHPGHTGIIYCLSKKDAETVAAGIMEASGGQIKTGVYHSEIGDGEKERLHLRWRRGEVQVVCATIAFGLGIDKGDVRFVLHHSMSKSIDGFYQESGRAGRDGKDADCVLFFRGQDATRLSQLVSRQHDGADKIHDMLRFALDKKECRKIFFANYFSASSSLSLSAWSEDSNATTLDRCGHCDNCTREPGSVATRDVTLEAWSLCKVAEHVSREGGRLTIAMLSDLARGNAGGSFDVNAKKKGRKGKQAEKVGLDLDEICGGKIGLTKDETEALIIQLMLCGYLKEEYSATAYAINVYVRPGDQSARLSRQSKDDVLAGNGPRIEATFVSKQKARAKRGRPSSSQASKSQGVAKNRSLADLVAAGNSRRANDKVKGKGKAVDPDDSPIELETDLEDDEAQHPAPTRGGQRLWGGIPQLDSDADDDNEEMVGVGWSFSLRHTESRPIQPTPTSTRPTKRTLGASARGQEGKRKTPRTSLASSAHLDVETVELSSD